MAVEGPGRIKLAAARVLAINPPGIPVTVVPAIKEDILDIKEDILDSSGFSCSTTGGPPPVSLLFLRKSLVFDRVLQTAFWYFFFTCSTVRVVPLTDDTFWAISVQMFSFCWCEIV